ncbi:MAG: hypothetical protein JXB48_10720, partial [Candidatus Latescibacteria bacterium]|nr:hypothetical protein [Candidatus Latescibacterota bacterium]
VRIDPNKTRGSYFILDIYERVPVKKYITGIDFYGSLGASQPRYYGQGLKTNITLTDALLGVGIPFDFCQGVTVTPLAEFTALLGGNLRQGIEDRGRSTEAWTYGITLSKGFGF